MIGDDRMIESLRKTTLRRGNLLAQVLNVLDRGAEFQCGPKGKHLALREEIRQEVEGKTPGPGVLILAKTAAGSLSEHTLPWVTRSELIQVRDVVELGHMELGHHLDKGRERSDMGFAGFVKGCVPQSEAREIIQKAAKRDPDNVPSAALRILNAGNLDSMILLYAVTLKLAKSKAKVGGGVWIEDRTA